MCLRARHLQLDCRKNVCTFGSVKTQNQKEFEEEFERLVDEIREQINNRRQSAAYLACNRLGKHIRQNWKITTSAEAIWNGQEAEAATAERREGVEE
jgi:hypothetical protein